MAGSRRHIKMSSMETILIVDDHRGFRRQVRLLLEAEGFSVLGEATDGATAIELARALRPDIVLLDIGLPDMDGFEVARTIRREGLATDVVLTSSREATEYGPRLDAADASGFIPKDELSGAAIRALRSEAG